MFARIFAYALLFVLVAVSVPSAQARTPTQAELEQLKRFGLGNLGVVSDNDFKLLYGGCPSDPYSVLEAMRTGTNTRLRPDASGQTSVSTLKSGIDPVLACRLTKLFEFGRQNGCSFQINSAFRDEADQARACTNVCGNPRGCAKGCAPPGDSCHQYGLAIDVTGSQQCLLWLRRVSPQFELHFPYNGNHIQCKEHKVASCSRSTPSCNGSVQITTDPRNLSGPNASSAPLGLDAVFRNALGQQSPPPLSAPLNTTQQNSLNSAFSPVGTPSGSLSFVNTGTSGGTSVADTLQNMLTQPTTTATPSTPGPVPVTISTTDVAYLTPPPAPPSTQTPQPYVPTPGIGSSQTFTSPDLALPPLSHNQSTVQAALNEMRAQLASVLTLLQPFGGLGLGEVHE